MTSQIEAEIPISIRQYIAKQNISYAIDKPQEADLHVEVCLLRDEQGLVQLFVPSNSIAELQAVRSLTDRPNLKPLPSKEIRVIQQRLNIENLPAFDSLLDGQTIIEESLLQEATCKIHSGKAGKFIHLPDSHAMRSQESTRIDKISARVPYESIDYELSLFEKDRDDIHSAVNKFTALRIKQRLEETLEVPPLPDTAQAIIRLRVDPNANIEKLSQIVERDPSLAAQVVSWASSSYYSAPGSIKSVQDAIVRVLGYDLVMNLALGLSLGKTLDLPAKTDDGYPDYWSAAVYIATCCGALVGAIPKEFRPSFGLSYLTGLLHNFGFLLFAHVFKPYFESTCDAIQLNRHINHQHVEKNTLGITRDQMASCLMDSWNMPREVTLGIRYQSDPHYLGEHSDQAHLVYLANHLLAEYGFLPKPMSAFDATVYEHLHLTHEAVDSLMAQLKESKQELEMIATTLGTS